MRVRAAVQFWNADRVVIQESTSWRILEWPSANLLAEGAGTLVPGTGDNWATISDGVFRHSDGQEVDTSGAVSAAVRDQGGWLAVIDGRQLWRLDDSGDARLLCTADRIGNPQTLGDLIGFERVTSSHLPGVVGEAPDVRRFCLVDRAGGGPVDAAPNVSGWTYGAVPSPADPGQLAFVHTELPGPYRYRAAVLTDGAPRFPFPDEVARFGRPPAWSPDGSRLATIGVDGIRTGIVTCAANGDGWEWFAPADGVHTSPAPTPDGGVLSIWQDLDTPPAVVLNTAEGSTVWARLLEQPDWWPTRRIQLVHWKSAGDTIEGLVATPPGPGPFRTVIDLHGGPDGMTQQASLGSYAIALDSWVEAGIAVFAPDYRESGIAGFEAKLAANRMLPGRPASHDDVISGIDQLIADGIADPNQLYLFGFSMGGLAGGHVIARDERIRAAVFWEPSVDTRMVDNAILRRQLGGAPDEVPEVWDRVSLFPLAGQTRTPVLIMSAGRTDTPGARSRARWHELLPTSDLLSFSDEGHVPSPAMRAEIIERAVHWFGRW